MDYLQLYEDYKHNKLSKFDRQIINLFKIASNFNKGKLSVAFGEHFKAYEMLDLKKENNGT